MRTRVGHRVTSRASPAALRRDRAPRRQQSLKSGICTPSRSGYSRVSRQRIRLLHLRSGAHTMTDTIVLAPTAGSTSKPARPGRPTVVVVDGNRIAAINPAETPSPAIEIDLGDVTLLPGLMDMEINLPRWAEHRVTGPSPAVHGVQDDPVFRTLRATVNARTTLLAGFTTVRNLGLMVKTGGYLLDVALQRSVDAGWVVGPRIFRPDTITPTGRSPRPDDVPAHGTSCAAVERRGRHRQRGLPKSQSSALPDQTPHATHQALQRPAASCRTAVPLAAQQYSDEEIESHRRRSTPHRSCTSLLTRTETQGSET